MQYGGKPHTNTYKTADPVKVSETTGILEGPLKVVYTTRNIIIVI